MLFASSKTGIASKVPPNTPARRLDPDLPGFTGVLVGLHQEIGHVAPGEFQQGVGGVLDALSDRETVKTRHAFHLSGCKGRGGGGSKVTLIYRGTGSGHAETTQTPGIQSAHVEICVTEEREPLAGAPCRRDAGAAFPRPG